MYAAFNFETNKFSDNYFRTNQNRIMGEVICKKYGLDFEGYIKRYLFDEECLDGDTISREWFPEINADIFLSHSHKDKEIALELAGFLYYEFVLSTFIDSYAWGYSNDLLKCIDNKYCLKNNGEYDYDLRNISTSHVHMMLAVALEKMMDKSECVFFLNTENSTNKKITDTVRFHETTFSPWIYFELSQLGHLRRYCKRKGIVHKLMMSYRSDSGGIRISYGIDASNMKSVSGYTLSTWKEWMAYNRDKHPLDVLYYITKVE